MGSFDNSIIENQTFIRRYEEYIKKQKKDDTQTKLIEFNEAKS